MNAFVPTSGLATVSGSTVGSRDNLTALRPTAATQTVRRSSVRMNTITYPYTGSGYGAAGVPYGGDPVGQSFRETKTADIVQTAASVPVFSTLVSLLQETGLDYELAKGGPFTVLAPTDTAFASLLEPHGFKILAPLLRPENRGELKKVLTHHVIAGDVSSGAILANGKMEFVTMAGCPISLMGYGKRISAGSAAVVKADIPCTNGVIHVISSVIIPMSYEKPPTGPPKKNFFNSTVLDLYKNRLTPRQALGIDPLPEGYDSTALSKFE